MSTLIIGDNQASEGRRLWEVFYRLAPDDEAALQRFAREYTVVKSHTEAHPDRTVTVPWDLSGAHEPTQDDMMSAADLRTEHYWFVKRVDLTRQWQRRDKRQPVSANEREELRAVLLVLNESLMLAHPRVFVNEDGDFWLDSPGDQPKQYVTLSDIYLSFVEDLAGARLAACRNCNRPFTMTPKQLASKKHGRRVYCSVACRVQFLEALPERKARKLATAKAWKNQRGRAKVGRGR